ncbi:hypothetical protein Dsin_017815 [Dipteronia sinensis]|uniref:Uncharacterized protein n=1 Tax=Dipteronia sinensis TaxID=43782 RepID=A0AAE0E6W7_9ROSI|nr:hypothetical protein Dsin_017815 [Dipteronia sinensis]
MEGSMTKYGDRLRAVLMGRLKSSHQNKFHSENHRSREVKSRSSLNVEKENDYLGHNDLKKVHKVMGSTMANLGKGEKTKKTMVKEAPEKQGKEELGARWQLS